MTRQPKHYPTDIYAIRSLFDRAIDTLLSATLDLQSAVSLVLSVASSTPGAMSPKLAEVLREALNKSRVAQFEAPGPECYFRLVGERETGTPEVIGERHATFAAAQMQALGVMDSREYDRVTIEAVPVPAPGGE